MKPILIQIMGKESGDRWILTGSYGDGINETGDWVYDFRLYGKDYRMTVPYGFSNLDGASVPRLLHSVVRMGGRDMPDEAWIPHDFIYHHKGKMPPMSLQIKKPSGGYSDIPGRVSKKFADDMMHAELKKKKHGLSSFKPKLAYLGVRAAFWKKW